MAIRTRIDPTTAERPAAPSRPKAVLRSALLLVGGAVLSLGGAACSVDPVDTAGAVTAPPPVVAAAVVDGGAHGADVAALRSVTAPFHRFDVAQSAGWTALVPGCRDNPPLGGMGWHYANPAYLDGVLDVREPEALIYEPLENGSLGLVGVEYVVPFSVLPPEAEPPELFGQAFQRNFGDELWMLHVWAWKHNPDGLFATWNPMVSCRYAR